MPPLDPDVADLAPSDPALTVYHHEHGVTYMLMLDADAEGADWREVARTVLHIDADREPYRARLAFESHLARTKWMTKDGYCAQHLPFAVIGKPWARLGLDWVEGRNLANRVSRGSERTERLNAHVRERAAETAIKPLRPR